MATDVPEGEPEQRTTADSSALPVAVPDEMQAAESMPAADGIEPRPYIEIRPAEAGVDPVAVTRAMEQVQALLAEHTETGLIATLRRSTQVPQVEWLLVSDGRPDPQIRYLVGTDHPDLIEDLTGLLRRCFPPTYELREVTWHPRYVEEFLPIADPETGRHSVTFPTGEVVDTTVHPYVAGVEYYGRTKRSRDWQTPLMSFAGGTGSSRRSNPSTRRSQTSTHRSNASQRQNDGSSGPSIAPLIETMSNASVPVVYQLVCEAHDDWSEQADDYIHDLEHGTATLGARLWEAVSPRTEEEREQYTPPASDRKRIEAITERDPQRTLRVSARAAVLTRTDRGRADRVARQLKTALSAVDGPHHELRGEIVTDADLKPLGETPPGTALFEEVIERTVHSVTYESVSNKLPWNQFRSRGIVVAPAELPGLCLVDGTDLTPDGHRALATRPIEQTALMLPPPQQLMQYTPPGMALGMPLTHDRQPYGQPFYLKPSQQDRHLVVVGDTGSGKSVLMEGGMVTNAAATDGPEILFDYKGGGTAEEYLRAHYAEYGDLDDVLYFDLSRVLPAFSFFDIEPLLEAGVPREEARSRKAGHYAEILEGVMGAENYGKAAESVKAIDNHLRALYDPVHGSDTIDHDDLISALRQTQRGEAVPSTTDENLTDYFHSLDDLDRDVFNAILGGAVGRVENIATDGRLAPVFEHTPDERDGPDETETGDSTTAQPSFDFTELVDEDNVIVFDFAGMEGKAKRTLTLVILSNLWTALKARAQRRDHGDDPPQVNCYLEEARDVGGTKLLDTLLSEGRSFGLSIALGLQFLEQLESPDPENNTYQEALNETATFVVGNVSVDTDLPRVLATEAMSVEEVDKRLTGMSRGEWLVRPGTDFGEPAVRPFLAQSLAAPSGHPASDDPLSGAAERAFQAAFERVRDRTAATAGLRQHDAIETATDADASDDTDATDSDPDADTADSESAPQHAESIHPDLRTDTLLPHTRRMPDCVTYDDAADALCCAACHNRYDPSIDGMVRAIECCHSMEEVDADDIPICEFNLKLSPDEIVASEWSLTQLLFIQAVYNAEQRRYDPRAYDLKTDSMLRLEEYVGIDREELQPLLDADLVRHDTDHPHRLYSVSPDGRSVIGEAYRRGVDFGHGRGDLEESSEHVFGVEVGIELLEQQYRDDPESAVETVSPYHELTEGSLPAAAFMGDGSDIDEDATGYDRRRLDVAGLDSEGNVVVTVEVERVNNDVHRAVPEDYDKMAACDPAEAIWIVMARKDGHQVLSVLNDPPEGEPRVEKTYSRNTPPRDFRIDTPGMTAIYPAEYVRDTLLNDD
ncbi:ATP-binding protein [Halosimplex pelagicum]|uniref:ATP-binding protein n=1 Tax=Halosimplex pelagicum TaxID=869886 RepID=A0A7D5PC74_9EURY|nr:hypothetical protein [Halosimplex pelagicum]QLH84821.1 hypothetical protein HZS54_25745 [Halosimplex pelagicum]